MEKWERKSVLIRTERNVKLLLLKSYHVISFNFTLSSVVSRIWQGRRMEPTPFSFLSPIFEIMRKEVRGTQHCVTWTYFSFINFPVLITAKKSFFSNQNEVKCHMFHHYYINTLSTKKCFAIQYKMSQTRFRIYFK